MSNCLRCYNAGIMRIDIRKLSFLILCISVLLSCLFTWSCGGGDAPTVSADAITIGFSGSSTLNLDMSSDEAGAISDEAVLIIQAVDSIARAQLSDQWIEDGKQAGRFVHLHFNGGVTIPTIIWIESEERYATYEGITDVVILLDSGDTFNIHKTTESNTTDPYRWSAWHSSRNQRKLMDMVDSLTE